MIVHKTRQSFRPRYVVQAIVEFSEHQLSCIKMLIMLPKPCKHFKELYVSQTKILEDQTNGRACDFEVLFKGVSTRFGRRTVEKCIENTRSIFCSVFQNLRLGGINWQSLSQKTQCQYQPVWRTKIARFQGPLLNEETDHT